MPSKYRSSIIKNQDVAAVDFVVGSDLEVADFLTIQEALANLPAGGGSIGLLAGTLPVTASIVLPDKPVKIVGAGVGATTISLGASAIALFTSAFTRHYEFIGFRVTGTDVAGQEFLLITANGGFEDILVENVEVSTVRVIFRTSGSANPQVFVRRSKFDLPNGATSLYWSGGSSLGGTVFSDSVVAKAFFGGTSGFTGNPRAHMVDCDFDLGNGGAFREIFAVETIFREGTITLGAVTGTNSIIQGCRFFGVPTRYIDILSTAVHDNITIDGNYFDPNVGGTDQVRIAADFCVVIGNIFWSQVTRSLDVLAACTRIAVTGNVFRDATSESVRTAGTNGVYVGNSSNAGFFVIETVGANSNYYRDNHGGVITIVGADSVTNGSRKKGVTAGATTAAFVQQFVHTNPKGLLGIGTIKNTGGVNALEVQETVTDAFGLVAVVTTTVAAGGDYMLDPQTNFSTTRPPYVSYAVSVRHPVAATTFDLQFTSQEAVDP